MTDPLNPTSGPALDPDAVLKAGLGRYESIVILGHTADGKLEAAASLNLRVDEAIGLLEIVKARLVAAVIDDPDDDPDDDAT